jgi:hypothetical protein
VVKKSDFIVLFSEKRVRRCFDEKAELWYFSVIDVIEVLTDSERPRKYWNDLKKKLEAEGSQLSEKIGQLKMTAPDGKRRLTDAALRAAGRDCGWPKNEARLSNDR